MLRARPTPPDPQTGPRQGGRQLGATSGAYGAPEAEFDVPYGHVAQNTGYAMIAQRYKAVYGYDERAMAKIAVDQRTNACANPDAFFYGQPITIDDVLASKMIADPLHLLEIVMPAVGGAAFIVARKDIARSNANRPAVVRGFGEHIQCKSPSYADDMLVTPIGPASKRAFAMAGLQPADMNMAEVYDCYTITVLLTLEDAGFCEKGTGPAVRARARPDLARRLPAQHPRRPAQLRPGRHGRRRLAAGRGGAADPGPLRRAAGGAARPGLRLRHRRGDERTDRADPGRGRRMTDKPLPHVTPEDPAVLGCAEGAPRRHPAMRRLPALDLLPAAALPALLLRAPDLEDRLAARASCTPTPSAACRPCPSSPTRCRRSWRWSQLDEGPHLNTTLVGADEDQIKVGMRVRPVFDDIVPGETTLLRYTAKARAAG